MDSIPRKISLIAQTEEVLLEGIRLGRWEHSLPGERLLSQELRISRWTLRAALAELAKNGFVKISQGLSCIITERALHRRQRGSHSRKVVLLTPAPLFKLRLFIALWVDELRIILNENGIELSIHDSDMAYRPNPRHALNSLIDKYPHNDWLILRSTRTMQEWFQTRSEFVVIAGTRFEGIHLPAIDIAFRAVGVHAAHTLLGLGHRRLVLFVPSVPEAGVLATEGGLKEAVCKARTAADLLVVPCEEGVNEICRAVHRVITGPAIPSVLIGTRANFVLTAYSHLMNSGFRVPQDISLLSTDWEPFLDMILPHISHYKISPTQFARKVAWAFLRSPGCNAKETYLNPQFVPGGSLRRLPT